MKYFFLAFLVIFYLTQSTFGDVIRQPGYGNDGGYGRNNDYNEGRKGYGSGGIVPSRHGQGGNYDRGFDRSHDNRGYGRDHHDRGYGGNDYNRHNQGGYDGVKSPSYGRYRRAPHHEPGHNSDESSSEEKTSTPHTLVEPVLRLTPKH